MDDAVPLLPRPLLAYIGPMSTTYRSTNPFQFNGFNGFNTQLDAESIREVAFHMNS